MGEVQAALKFQGEAKAEGTHTQSGKTEGTLKGGGVEHDCFAYEQTESVSQGVSEFLQEINEPPPQEIEQALLEHEFQEITEETIEIEQEIESLEKDLAKLDSPKKGREKERTNEQKELQKPENTRDSGKESKLHSSIFSLARSFSSSKSEGKEKPSPLPKSLDKNEGKNELRTTLSTSYTSTLAANLPQAKNSQFDREGDGRQEQEEQGSGQHDPEQQKKQQQKQEVRKGIGGISAATTSSGKTEVSREERRLAGASSASDGGGVDSLFIRFMALMARILGQAEAEAHDLYLRVKERTDNVDTLTALISKLNSEKKGVDWTKDEEMKSLVDRARELGVDIPEGKYKWSDDEKRLLKENIQMRKDSMEKLTQLERTDMQRYLQEASQCHQARSNILKLLKEVGDTFIHNIRP
ncbi:MAG: hypothetical protein K940chlam9_00721 [Chlamydiae bacterium]|nr:hypothetical protein [Chlamydiota bacterium]